MAAKSNSMLTARGREMYGVIERYLSSGLKQRAFCKDSGLTFTTFQYWLSCYRSGNDLPAVRKQPARRQAEGKSGDFVALKPDIDLAPATRYPFEINLPNGVILRLIDRPDAAWLSEVLAAMRDRR